ncbi:MAG TPA: hypothetical protein VLE89_04070 [Chlamydiales bacterium]|nr:hypothetical protein [Chlamydiales bacterium]
MATTPPTKRLYFQLTESQETRASEKEDSKKYVTYSRRISPSAPHKRRATAGSPVNLYPTSTAAAAVAKPMGSREVIDLTRDTSSGSSSSSSSQGAGSIKIELEEDLYTSGPAESSDPVKDLIGYLSTVRTFPTDGQLPALEKIHGHFSALKGFHRTVEGPGIEPSVKAHYWFRCAQCYAYEHLAYKEQKQADTAKRKLDKAIHFLHKMDLTNPPSPWPTYILSLAAVLYLRRNNPEDESSVSDVTLALLCLDRPFGIANSPSVRAPLYYYMALEFQKIGRNDDYIEFLKKAKEQPFMDDKNLLEAIDTSLSQALHEQSLLKGGK